MMTPAWRRDELPGIVAKLASRPGHTELATLITDILRGGFGVGWDEIAHEVRLPRVGGRIDSMFGNTVFEFKSDLRRELAAAERKLPDYLSERERQTGERFMGIATDGATFIAYRMNEGRLETLTRHETQPDQGAALLGWLAPALSPLRDVAAEPLAMQRALGRDSLVFAYAKVALGAMWARLRGDPEVALKRQLWDALLREVYGTPVGDDGLFLQHSYLTIIAKTIAAGLLDVPMDDAQAILSGRALEDYGIKGAVESDFFDWVLRDAQGPVLVMRIVEETRRFALRRAESDVLKALYESLIDPAQRKELGEYYTPDWLAAKLCRAVITAPLSQRVLDPACGSGTFLFHAIKMLIAAGEAAGWPPARIVAACEARVRGMDVHPVAVIFARVTWLLALGPVIGDRAGTVSVPVYLGDAMQWNVRTVDQVNDVLVRVPGEKPLTIPGGFAEAQERFEPALEMLTEGLRHGDEVASVRRRLAGIVGASARDVEAVSETYAHLKRLFEAGRDGIWPFVMRNLRRPLWLSTAAQRADVVVGNPPWVAFRFLSAEMQTSVRAQSQVRNLWVGGALATQQDLCALFMAKVVELYLKKGGVIGFVLPYAALNRPAFAGLRAGDFNGASMRVRAAWSFDEKVQPLFPVPACVLIAARETAGALPAIVTRYAGVLHRRDADEAAADAVLRVVVEAWPPIPTLRGASPYRARFKQGATIVPRRFYFVEREAGGRLGVTAAAPLVRGINGTMDKAPWKSVTPPRGQVEAVSLRNVLLGSSLAPFRLLETPLAVIPMVDGHVMDSRDAGAKGLTHLSRWLQQTEGLWEDHCSKDENGKMNMTLKQSLDHMKKLSIQYPTAKLRVVYSASGTTPAAVFVDDHELIVEHAAYWTSVRSRAEGDYLCAVINAPATTAKIEDLQAKGQGGARHFDNLVWELVIPEYDRRDALHEELAAVGAQAAVVAAQVILDEGQYFTTQRKLIRGALTDSGVSARLDALVSRLLAA